MPSHGALNPPPYRALFRARVKTEDEPNLRLKKKYRDSGCGSVGRAVTSYTRGPWFEYSQSSAKLYNDHIVEKTK